MPYEAQGTFFQKMNKSYIIMSKIDNIIPVYFGSLKLSGKMAKQSSQTVLDRTFCGVPHEWKKNIIQLLRPCVKQERTCPIVKKSKLCISKYVYINKLFKIICSIFWIESISEEYLVLFTTKP